LADRTRRGRGGAGSRPGELAIEAAITGRWTLHGLTAVASDFETGELFGTDFVATFRRRHTLSLGTFKKTPRPDWTETIMMKGHGKREARGKGDVTGAGSRVTYTPGKVWPAFRRGV
jgi:hypothetical protein